MKKDIRLPQYEIMPCWYELFLKDENTIGIRVHRCVLAEFETIPWSTAPVIPHLMNKYRDLKSFTGICENSWGFNNAFTADRSEDPDWMVLFFKLPNIKAEYEDDNHTKTHIAIRATLYMFTLSSCHLELNNLDMDKNQLMIVDHINLPETERFASGSLSATLTPAVLPWIIKQPEGHVKEIQDAMRTAHNLMWDGASRSERYGARITHSKWIYLDVPGDACDLSPDNNGNNDMDQGYTLVPHNVDSGLQQLTFVAGLSKMHDLIRADGF